MQNQIIPIDILERFEDENDLSAAPPADLIYVFCPNTDISNNISSYSAYGMTVSNLIQLYNGFCEWDRYNKLKDEIYALSGYYYNVLQPIMLSAFPTTEELKHTYMCRVKRSENDFPYYINKSTHSGTKKMTLIPNDNLCSDYITAANERGSDLMYHEWADFKTKRTDIATLAWLAPGSSEALSDNNAIAHDKYLEYRRQKVTALLQNRKRVVTTHADVYARALSVSREIRFDNKEYNKNGKAELDKDNMPDLKLKKEILLDIQLK